MFCRLGKKRLSKNTFNALKKLKNKMTLSKLEKIIGTGFTGMVLGGVGVIIDNNYAVALGGTLYVGSLSALVVNYISKRKELHKDNSTQSD
jgi:hypothetical protein